MANETNAPGQIKTNLSRRGRKNKAQKSSEARPHEGAGLGQTPSSTGALSLSLINALEDERQRLARDLHDDLLQRLAMLQASLQEIAMTVGLPDESVAKLKRQADFAASIGDELRRIARGLHPAALEDLGLALALRGLVEELARRESLPVKFREKGVSGEHVDRRIALAFYRIAQEALWNVARHAGPTRVLVALERKEGMLKMSIRDFGRGFDPETVARSTGLGLTTMKERMKLAGGTFRIRSAPGWGTSIHVSVAIAPETA